MGKGSKRIFSSKEGEKRIRDNKFWKNTEFEKNKENKSKQC